MRVAILHPSMDTKGGAERVVSQIARGLSKRGHSITIFTSKYLPDLWGEPEGFEVVESDQMPGGNPKEWLEIGEDLAERLTDFDIVNPHNFPSYIWVYGAKTKLRERCPKIIWYCHEPLRKIYRKITDPKGSKFIIDSPEPAIEETDRKAVAEIDFIICNSRFTAMNINRIFGIHATVCHPGVSDGQNMPSGCERRNIRIVSRLTPEKNLERIIDVMVLIREMCPALFGEIAVEIVGEGPDENKLRILARDEKIDNLIFRGYLPDEELPAFYAGAKAVIYIPLDEPYGLVPLEAMLFGAPVIASNQCGIQETVIDRVTGLLVDPMVTQAVADAVIFILTHSDKAEEMGTSGRKRVLERFSVSRFIDRIERKFQLLGGLDGAQR